MRSRLTLAFAALAATFVVDAVPLDERAYSIAPQEPPGFAFQRIWPDKVLPYCFSNADARTRLSDNVNKALDRWRNAPGGLGGISFVEVICNVNNKPYLEISAVNSGASTTLAFHGPNADHTLQINPDGDYDIGIVGSLTHEIGHALGLEHEHQRPTAVSGGFVTFECTALADYQTFAGNGYDMRSLCSSVFAASSAGFSAAEFLQYPPTSAFVEQGDFDLNSVMMYGSRVGNRANNGPRDWPLKLPNDRLLQPSDKPSATDMSRLRNLYNNDQAAAAADAASQDLAHLPSQLDESVLDRKPYLIGACKVDLTEIEEVSITPGSGGGINGFTINATILDSAEKPRAWVANAPAGDKNRLSIQGLMPQPLIVVPEIQNDYIQFYYGSDAWTSGDNRCQVSKYDSGATTVWRHINCSFHC